MSGALISTFLILLHVYAYSEHRRRRFLIYPQGAPTRHQFIAGIGIPAELEEQSVTVGYVFKVQFYLPYNVTIWHTYPIVPEFREKRNKLEFQNRTTTNNIGQFRKLRTLWKGDFRWEIYKILEYIITTIKPNEKECLLLAICESAQVPIHSFHDQSVFSEIIRVLLTPSLTPALVGHSSQNIYLEAEKTGKSGCICRKKFSQCSLFSDTLLIEI